MKVTIDRFEGDFAVAELENRGFANIPKVLVPDAKEGDVIRIEIDKEETKIQKENIKQMMDSLFE